jgi:hypothetical protein
MKLFLLILAGTVLFSCQQANFNPTNTAKIDTTKPDTTPIRVLSQKAVVSQTGLFGFVGKGSCVFDYSNAQDGYSIKVMKGDIVLSTMFTDRKGLNIWVRRLKDEFEKDSLLFTVPKQK